MASKLIDFYRNLGTNDRGRTLRSELIKDWNWMEDTHDYIQWWFPLFDPSQATSDSPVLTAEDVCIFHSDRSVRMNLLLCFEAMLEFYGLELADGRSSFVLIEPSPVFEGNSEAWLTPGNHNFLRITRILKSLRILGLKEYSDAFFASLIPIYNANRDVIGEVTYGFWCRATAD
jgi:hypothetical protein